ncbi:MAG: EVE domain-containing protein [Bacillota bacterium]
MAYWLMKTEPEEYGFHHLELSGRDVWDGVRNFAALRNMKKMQPGDLAFIYHTGKEKSIVGVAEVISRPYPDPGEKGLINVEIAPMYRLSRPVSLAEVKRSPLFAGWELVRLPRLSVMPVAPEYWLEIHRMSGGKAEI